MKILKNKNYNSPNDKLLYLGFIKISEFYKNKIVD